MTSKHESELRVPIPDSVDGLDARLREARVRSILLSEPLLPVKIDRFTVLAHVGSGGMGEVYAAYDDKLERKVAIKLVRSDIEAGTRANQRLTTEAKVLARLSHPNVVQVYDAGEFEDRAFVAMELVRGDNLMTWLEQARTRGARNRQREILRCFIAAGRGLEAVHRAGLAHRDFKPDNVLVGEDGQVRVVDFGLARAVLPRQPGDGPEVPQQSLRPPETPDGVTVEGPLFVSGTPHYMAPEQKRGKDGDARSDQYSFCVALADALEIDRPADRADDRKQGASRAAVPAAVRRAIERGLSREPDDRFPSMTELLDALEAWPRRRRRVFMLGTAIVVLGLLAYNTSRWMQPAGPPAVTCDDARVELADVWNRDRRARVSGAIQGSAYAGEALPRILARVDRYVAEWTAMRNEACRAHESGRESSNLYDRRVVCLSRRRADLASAIDVLSETRARSPGQPAERAAPAARTVDPVSEAAGKVKLVESLPALASCADREALLAALPLPRDRAERGRVDALASDLGRARALEDAGRISEAGELVARIAEQAESTPYRPLLAQVLLAQGRLGIAGAYGHSRDWVASLHRALEIALELGLDEVAVEVFARLVFAESRSLDTGGQDPLVYVPMAEALSKRISDPRFVRALLANNVGALYMGSNKLARALDYFERSVASYPGPDVPIELLVARTNIAMVTPDAATRATRMAEAVRMITDRLGPHHPLTLFQHLMAAQYTRDPAAANATLEVTCQAYATYHVDDARSTRYCLYYRGFLEAELGRFSEAAEHLAAFAAIDPARAQTPEVLLARGHAQLYQHAYADAITTFRGVLELFGGKATDDSMWWADTWPAHAELGIGVSELARGRPARAITVLESALRRLERLCTRSHSAEFEQQHASAQLALGRALWAARPAGQADRALRTRVDGLVQAAEDWYRTAGAGYDWQLAAIAAWRRDRFR